MSDVDPKDAAAEKRAATITAAQAVQANTPNSVLLEQGADIAAFRFPDRAMWRKFKKERADEATSHIAVENLLCIHVIYPSREDFQAMLDRRAGLVDGFGLAFLRAAGMGEAQEAKK